MRLSLAELLTAKVRRYNMLNILTNDIVTCANQHMLASGIIPTNPITYAPHGVMQRFQIKGDKTGSKNGWIVFLNDKVQTAVYGDWKTREKYIVHTNDNVQHNNNIFYIKDVLSVGQQQVDLQEKHVIAAARAKRIWNRCLPAKTNHAYLIKKKIQPFIARQFGSTLVLPIVDYSLQIKSLQFIQLDGTKRMLFRGAKKGNFIIVNGTLSNRKIYIAEGFATAATVAMYYSNACVIAAIDCDNLIIVATEISRRYADASLYIMADDDRHTAGNPGLSAGRKAAIASGGDLIAPNWPANAPLNLTDFNDLMCWMKGE